MRRAVLFLFSLCPIWAQPPIETPPPKATEVQLLPPLDGKEEEIPDLTAENITKLGRYEVVSRLRIINGSPVPILTTPFQFELSSDGILLWLGVAGTEFKPTEFKILSSDGIQQNSADGRTSELVPGLQALGQNPARTRHLTISASTLQLVEFPLHSSDIIITRAKKLPASAPLPQRRKKAPLKKAPFATPPGITIPGESTPSTPTAP